MSALSVSKLLWWMFAWVVLRIIWSTGTFEWNTVGYQYGTRYGVPIRCSDSIIQNRDSSRMPGYKFQCHERVIGHQIFFRSHCRVLNRTLEITLPTWPFYFEGRNGQNLLLVRTTLLVSSWNFTIQVFHIQYIRHAGTAATTVSIYGAAR